MDTLSNIKSFFLSDQKKISGIVVRGKMKGRFLGFPTANISFLEDIGGGVYSGEVRYKGEKYKAAIFIGMGSHIAEAYIFDFAEDIYGEKIEMSIGKKLRNPIKFDSDEDLRAQIAADITKIKEM